MYEFFHQNSYEILDTLLNHLIDFQLKTATH